MHRPFYFLVALILSLAATSCNSDEPVSNNENILKRNSEYKVSVTEALSRANSMFSLLDNGTGQTRLHSTRIPSSIETVRSGSKTRGTNDGLLPDTLVYIINYLDDTGFAIVSADKRTVPVYAISEEGQFDINDTIYNKGLAAFFDSMEADIAHSIQKSVPIGPTPLDTTKNDDIDLRKTEQFGPYLSESVSRWHQQYPFNRICCEINGFDCVVGCTAIALGQILAYHRFPFVYNNHIYYWNLITTDHYCDDVAYLLYDLGRPENLNMSYGSGLSTAQSENIDRTLFNIGYEHCGEGIPFTKESIKKYLKTGPVYFSARRYGNDGVSHGHAFVCDGYFEYLLEAKPVNQDIMYHCVWGWRGNSNGYYYWTDGFDLDNPAKLDDGVYVGSDSFYNHGFKIWGDFKIRQ